MSNAEISFQSYTIDVLRNVDPSFTVAKCQKLSEVVQGIP